MPGQAVAATRLAEHLLIPIEEISIHVFPDEESLVRIREPTETALVYCTLDHPNEKLIHLLLTVSALRDNGTQRVVLVAPYLCYMRQDKAFNSGEAVSQRPIAELLARLFDRIVTVDPHLHRTRCLNELFGETEAVALSASPYIGKFLKDQGYPPETVIVGPDAESRQWVETVASTFGSEVLIGKKQRCGDESVQLNIPEVELVSGRPVVIVDDLVVSGGTVRAAARLLHKEKAASIDVVAVHALFSTREEDSMHVCGVRDISSTDSIAHQSNAIELAPLLVGALISELSQ